MKQLWKDFLELIFGPDLKPGEDPKWDILFSQKKNRKNVAKKQQLSNNHKVTQIKQKVI